MVCLELLDVCCGELVGSGVGAEWMILASKCCMVNFGCCDDDDDKE